MSNTDFRFRIGIFRQMGDLYARTSLFAIISVRQNQSETQGRAVMNPTSPQLVFQGDRLAVFVRRLCSNGICPLQPNLRAAPPVSIFFASPIAVTAIPVTQFEASESYTNVYLDVSASIGKYNSMYNVWWPWSTLPVLLLFSPVIFSGQPSVRSFLIYPLILRPAFYVLVFI